MAAATAVYVDDGSAEDHDGDEVREWHVCLGDDDGEPVGKTVSFSSFGAAVSYAEVLAAKSGGLEVVTG